MKKRKLFIISSLVISFILVSIGIIQFIRNYSDGTQDNDAVQDENIIDDERQPISSSERNEHKEEPDEGIDYHISANIVWWDQSAGYQVLVDNPTLFNSVSPFWYSFNEDGSLNKTSYAENQTLINHCKANNILLLPTFTNGLTTKVSRSIFNDNDAYNTAIENIITKIQTNGYDGIQLDFENMEEQDKSSFTNFVSDLYDELKSIDKVLIITLQAKTSEQGTSKANKAQDWGKIGKVSNYVNIMAYDYHWSTSGPGEIAPISWIREILEYGTDVIDKEKILLGV
ncbi:MAG: glycosyl hydrolase family 18 protein, partial [bacterium]